MSTIRRIEDLEVWQEARKLCQGIYVITAHFPYSEKYNLTKHLQENARGVPSNIAEGFGRYFYKDSLRFYGITKGCLGEMKSDIYLAFDVKYFNKEILDKFVNQINLVERKLNGLIANIMNRMNAK